MKPTPLEFEKPIVELETMLNDIQSHSQDNKMDFEKEVLRLRRRLEKTRRDIYSSLTPWQRVQIVRHPQRPYALDYLQRICSDFLELQGDRLFGDDQALIGGLATLDTIRCVFLAHQKGRDTKENLRRNFGCAHPEGYRKALRLMRLAHRFKLPIICLIDTPGAYPGIPSEERHIAEAIAVNLREMFSLQVPIVATVIGEGGSGGALGIGVADRLLLLENSYYSVISPEGCASILWKDRAFAPQAAEALKLTAPDLKKLGLIDEIIPEPEGGAHYDWDVTAASLKSSLLNNLRQLLKIRPKALIDQRYRKYRAMGAFHE